jgi:hypothetical protein
LVLVVKHYLAARDELERAKDAAVGRDRPATREELARWVGLEQQLTSAEYDEQEALDALRQEVEWTAQRAA